MVPLKYIEAVSGVLARLEQTDIPRIEEAAGIIVESLRKRRRALLRRDRAQQPGRFYRACGRAGRYPAFHIQL